MTSERRIRHTLKLSLFIAAVLSVITFFALTAQPVSAAESGLKVRVGMKYGTSSPDSYNVTSTSGFVIGVQQITGTERNFTPVVTYTGVGEISVSTDRNLQRSNGGFVPSPSVSYVMIGGHHVQLTRAFTNPSELNNSVNYVNSVLNSTLGYRAFPAYIDGTYRIRIGTFRDQASAENGMTLIRKYLADGMNVVAPSANGTSVITPDDCVVLFEYAGSDAVGVKPVSESGYIKAPNGYIYEGVFAFPRYVYGSTDGVSVLNVLDIDRYTAGVVPYEVYESWNEETLRAFAITARSYAIANFSSGNSSRYNFDLTNKMQVYNGAKSITDKVNRVVNDTSGLVIAYNGRVATAYYSSSMGGTTAYSGDIWSSYLPYLVSVNTPWERYSEFSNGLWFKEVSPADLAATLRGKGYTVNGNVSSVKITKYGSGTPYVTGLTITDSSNASFTISGGDNVRTKLGAYLKSSNFVVGRGSVSYKKDTVAYSDPVNGRLNLPAFTVISSLGKYISSNRSSYGVITGSGSGTLTGNDAYVSCAPGSSYTGSKGFYTVTTSSSVYNASSSSNFVFVGKGHGHGVGASQFGMRDLGVLGYSYEEIIHAYFTDVEVTNINNVRY